MGDEVVDFVRLWSGKRGVVQSRMLLWLSLGSSTFYGWRLRHGKVNERNRYGFSAPRSSSSALVSRRRAVSIQAAFKAPGVGAPCSVCRKP